MKSYSTQSMASNPEKELLVSAVSKDVSLGFLYDLSTKEFSPGDTKHAINIEKCTPEYVTEVISMEEISRLLEFSEVFRRAEWAQDFDPKNFLDCILLKGTQICEHRANVEPDTKLCVVSSVYYKSFIDFLICFDQQIEEKDIADLKSYINSVIEMSSTDNVQNNSEGTDLNRDQADITIAFIPPKINIAFSSGYIYEMGKRTVVSSIKYGLEEFCHYLLHSQVSKFPTNCKVKYPQVNYASVLKNKSTDNVPVQIPAVHSCYVDGVSDYVAHIVKPRQGDELPVAHNTQSNTKAKETTIITLSQHSDITMKNLDQSESIPDRTHSYLPRREKIPGKPVESGEHQVISRQVSDRNSWHHKGSEAHNTFEVPQNDACTQYSNKSMDFQSSQNLRRMSEYVELDRCASEKFKSGELKSNYSTGQNYALETHLEGKPNLPHLIHDDTHFSDKCQSSEGSQLKLEHKTVKSQLTSEKTDLDPPNKSEFNSSNSESLTLLMPVKELKVCGMIRKFYGVIPETEGKTIILLGASGSGKTTLVNFIGNYFSGNKKATGKLIQVVRNSNDIQGHTKQIIGYTFCASKNDNPLTIIDTPGLNDSSGAEVQDHVQSLKTFLANADSQNLKIHAIGFVAQAHIVRLTSSERLVMDYISSLFGKEIGDHVISFVTFSDNQESPPVVEAINSYGVSCNVFLKFNNSALTCNKEEEVDELDKIYWRIGCRSWKKCIKLLENLPPFSFKSLTDEVYETQIMEIAERDLRTEIKEFISHHRRNIPINKEMLNNAERVWTLAETIKELMYINVSQCTTVDNILQSHVEEVCALQNSSLSTKECIKLLSLSPSRPLLRAGLAIISSAAPIYNSIKQICGPSQQWGPRKDIPDMLFCHQCLEDHVLTRIENTAWLKSFKRNKNIGYKCTQCECDGDLHGKKENAHEDTGFTPVKLLQHAKDCIEKVLKDLCLPEHKIQEKEYIRWLKCFTKQEAYQFCDDLLHV